MRHLKDRRRLNRNATHRLALMRNLTLGLVLSEHGRIITTLAKAKEGRRFVEKILTLAKKAAFTDDKTKSLHYRRLIRSRLGPVGTTLLVNEDGDFVDVDFNKLGDKDRPITMLKKLVDTIAKRYKDRPGGYTRIIKRHERRLGDAGFTAYLELMKEGETKVRAKAKPVATAPKVAPETAEKKEEKKPAAPAAEKKPEAKKEEK